MSAVADRCIKRPPCGYTIHVPLSRFVDEDTGELLRSGDRLLSALCRAHGHGRRRGRD